MSFVGASALTVTLIVEAASTATSLEPQPVSVTLPSNCWEDVA